MSEQHPLHFILEEALNIAGNSDAPIQGSVVIKFTGGKEVVGQITWVSEDAQAFSLVRLIVPRIHGGVREYELADGVRHFATAHVVEIYYNETDA